MYTKNWLIIKDDNKRTFEVVTQEISENAFSNKVIGMQREGMYVTSVLMPITNRNASKEAIKFIGYTKEEGLFNRLDMQYQQLIQKNFSDWD
jgi:hypothetical protein